MFSALLLSSNILIAQATFVPDDQSAAIEQTTQQVFDDNIFSGIDTSLGSAQSITEEAQGTVEDADRWIDTTADGITNTVNGTIDKYVGVVNGGIQDVLGSETVRDVSGTINTANNTIGTVTQTINDALGLFGKAKGALDQILGLFNIQRILDMISFDMPDIADNTLEGLSSAGKGPKDGTSEAGSAASQEQAIREAFSPMAMGFPDPEKVEAFINSSAPSPFEEAISSKTGGSGSPAIKLDLMTKFDSDTAREIATETALTEAGQKKLAENAQIATASLQQSLELSADSETQDVSQNILRNISGQLSAGQQTNTLNALDSQLRARDDAYRNVLLSDAVDELQSARVEARRRNASGYSRVITQGSLFTMPGLGLSTQGE